MDVTDQSELQAMNKDLLKHKVQLVHLWWTIEMKGRTRGLDWGMLSMYDQDDLHQLVFVVREMPVELESENQFLR